MLRSLLALTALAVLFPAAAPLAQQSTPWQQRVAYEMDVHLLADRHTLRGEQRLVYTNNSPDTLRQVFYHLYFNAFQPTSMMAERNRHLPDPDGRIVPRIFELGPDEIGYYDIRSLTHDGAPVTFDIDDTVMQVTLARPIPPGQTATFEMTFEAQVPLQTRRSGRDSREGIDYTMTQWYPKMAAYDGLGWHADPYVGREFYAPFGTFDVRMTLPADYLVGATGILQNPEAVGHGYDQPPDIGLTSTGPAARGGTVPDSLTWHFRAENVHDFAWSADPDYLHVRHLVTDVPGRDEPVAVHLLFEPDVAQTWAFLPEWMTKLTRFFSAQYGAYAYPQFTIAQGGDAGMEYPMFTAITGRRSPGSLLGVTSHEFAHMWFYGMVGSNESDYAWMDEGFTGFADDEGVNYVLNAAPDGTVEPFDHTGARDRIATFQLLDLYERPNTPSDWFETNAGYTTGSYAAGKALADLLGYIMSDAVRDEFLREYVDRFTFRHPYPADVQAVAEDVSGLQLDWLFDQFLEGAARYDYGTEAISYEATGGSVRSTVSLRRHEPGVLPVDVRLRFADGSEAFVTVPPSVMYGHKPVPSGWTVAEPWPWTSPNYDFTVERSSRVIEAVVDPEGRMIDLDPSNNRVRVGGPDVLQKFAGFLRMPRTARDATTYALSPIGLYSNDYGVGVGAQLRAALPNNRGTFQLGLTLWPEVIGDENKGFSGPLPLVPPTDVPDFPGFPELPGRSFERDSSPLDGVDYTAIYTRRLRALGPLDELRLDAQKHLGIMENRISLTKVLGAYPILRRWSHTLTITLGHQHRTSDRVFRDLDPLVIPSPDFMLAGPPSTFGGDHLLSARVDYALGDANSAIAVFAEVGGSMGDGDLPFRRPTNANRLHILATKSGDIGPVRGLARLAFGLGSDDLSPQKRFGLGMATAETRWRSHAYRVLAAAPESPQNDLHFFALSGVGPVAYLLREPIERSFFEPVVPSTYPISGTRLLAGTLSLRADFPRVPDLGREWQAILAPLDFEVFSGFGALGNPFVDYLGSAVADAGIGVRYDVSALGRFSQVVAQSDVLSSLRLVAKFPLWASNPEFIGPDEEAFGFRWLVGIETGI